ncbi:hypothetical protein SDC9_107652 [bioreactor metagenome]|uniref:Uncharacterized protein n=1 Tax=bioreactor metagenome TaxID=1076179 RepID=A0A645B6X1_9ZZZZ
MLHSLHHRSGNASAHGKPPACPGGDGKIVGRVLGKPGEVNLVGVKHTLQFLKGQHIVHVGTDGLAVGLQLFRGAGADEADAGVGMPLFHQPGGDDHRGEGHGNIVLEFGEQLLRHHAPRRAAGGAHEGLVFRHILQKVLGLFNGAKVRADGHLHHVGKAAKAHGGL